MIQQKIIGTLQRIYVALIIAIVARALVALSRIDKALQQEVAGFASDTIIELGVLPSGPRLRVIVQNNRTFSLYTGGHQSDLSIQFKHISHAFLAFSFQEGTAVAIANDRIIMDGDLAVAVRFVRCLNKVESIILPKYIARRAVKHYSKLSSYEKISKALSVYASVAKQFVTRS